MGRVTASIAVFAGLTWGGMVGWAADVSETRVREQIRVAAFVVMFGAGMLTPVSRRGGEDEETL